VGEHFDRSGAWVSWILGPRTRKDKAIVDVIVTVDGGGKCEVIDLPPKIRIHVRDYYIEGLQPDTLETDSAGDQFLRTVYQNIDGKISCL
jgi:hypothetical protein